MSEKIRGIVLNVRKHSDKNCIVTLYTRERGRLSFISPVGSGKSSNARRARLQPLSVIETDLKFKSNVELQRLGSITSSVIWDSIYFHPVKSAMVLFLSEFLYKLLNETMSDPLLYDFLLDSFRLLDQLEDGIADFHIPFLVSLLSFSGIQPDVKTYRKDFVFDFASGSYVSQVDAKGPFLTGVEGEAVKFVSRINFSNMKCLRLNGINRRQILYGLLNYYSYHFPGLGTLKSPDVMREIFT